MKSEKNIVIYLLVLFASSATSCNKSISEKKQRFYYSTTCKNVDSIWQFFTVENDPIEIVQLLCNAQSNLSRLGLTDSSAKLIKKMDNLAGKLNNPRFYAYVYLNSAFESLVKGDMANALANFNRRNKYLNGADDINVLMSHQFKGNYYYMDGQIDSARGAFVNGYNLARDKGDTTMMYSFALNSGTTYFDLQLTSMAAYYFSEAYLIGVQRGDVSMMLINNLVATLISEGNYEEAIKKCEENQAKWMADPLNSGSILLKLNYSFLLNRQGEYKRSEHILREVSVKSIPKIHLSYYYANYLESLFSQNRKIDFKNMLDTLVPFVYSNQPRSTTEMKSILLKAVDSELFNPDLNRFIGFYKSSLIKDSDHYTSSEYCDFLSHVYKKKSQFNQANLWENRGIRHKLDLSITRDSLRLQDVVNQIAQVDLNHKLASKQKALDDDSWKNKLILIALFSSLLIVCILLFSLRLVLRNRKRRSQIFELENAMKENEILMLQKEKELKEKTITLAQSVLQQVSKLTDKIKTSSFSKDPDALIFRQDLERLSELSTSFSELESNSNFIYSDFDFLFEKIPTLNTLSGTERKILILTVIGSKPREIGSLLNLNDQYIRNVKSRIKKLLPLELQTMDWEQLRKIG